jgi:signal peptidase
MSGLSTIARAAVSLLTGLTVLLAVGYGVLLLAGYKPAAVYSGSMEPSIRVGAIAVDKPVSSGSVRVGDVITFRDPYVAGRIVTHRVVRILHTRRGLAYRTKGDANPTRDPWTIELPARVGRVAFDVPYVGYVLVYSHTREIRTVLIALASFAFLAFCLRAIWRRPPAEAVA